jgi:predicted ATPase
VITGVKIENFRGVREGGVEGLAPISILVGPNNSGKSTVLEAIGVVGKAIRANEIADLLLRRGGAPFDALEHVFNIGAKKARIELRGESKGKPTTWGTELSVTRLSSASVQDAQGEPIKPPLMQLHVMAEIDGAQYGPGGVNVNEEGRRASGPPDEDLPPAFPVSLVDVEAIRAGEALEDAHSRIGQAGQVDLVVQALRRSMPSLTGLAIFKSGSKFVLHSILGKGRPVPAYLAGDGFKRFLALAAAAVATPGGVVLLEEPEAYQHPRYLQELATLLHLAAREGTQIILSTHSIELVDFLLRAREGEGQTYPAVHRMALYEGKLRATSIDRDSAVIGRESLLEDLRA